MTTTLGIDVSFWQDDNSTAQQMDFDKAKQSGAEFVGIKASQANFVDDDILYNWKSAKKSELPRMAYHYLTWDVPAEAQARTFYGTVRNDLPELGLWVDYEKRTGIVSPGACRQKLQSTLVNLESMVSDNTIIGIYTSRWFWKEFGSTDPFWLKYPLWIAHYTEDEQPTIPSPWKEWTFWQYTAKGPGLAFGAESKQIDMDRFNGTKAEMYTWAGLKPTENAATMLEWANSVDSHLRLNCGYTGIKPPIR